MNYNDIKFHVEDGIGFITLNRPEKRNALSLNLMAEMIDLCQGIKKNPEVRICTKGVSPHLPVLLCVHAVRVRSDGSHNRSLVSEPG